MLQYMCVRDYVYVRVFCVCAKCVRCITDTRWIPRQKFFFLRHPGGPCAHAFPVSSADLVMQIPELLIKMKQLEMDVHTTTKLTQYLESTASFGVGHTEKFVVA